MKTLYVDEAGCTGSLPIDNTNLQPALAICGIVIDSDVEAEFTRDLNKLKKRFYLKKSLKNPGLADGPGREVKGSEIRRDLCGGHRTRTTARGFLRGIVQICLKYDVKIIGKVWIKAPGEFFEGNEAYTSSLKDMIAQFQHYLEEVEDNGIVIIDNRNLGLNRKLTHPIYVSKFHEPVDKFKRISGLPTFGVSEYTAGLQIADLLCSGIVWPVSVWTFCRGFVNTDLIRVGYEEIKRQFMPSIRTLEYRRWIDSARSDIGLAVDDAIANRSAALLFELPPAQAIETDDARMLPLFGTRSAA